MVSCPGLREPITSTQAGFFEFVLQMMRVETSGVKPREMARRDQIFTVIIGQGGDP
jgi:hypothetical protein